MSVLLWRVVVVGPVSDRSNCLGRRPRFGLLCKLQRYDNLCDAWTCAPACHLWQTAEGVLQVSGQVTAWV